MYATSGTETQCQALGVCSGWLTCVCVWLDAEEESAALKHTRACLPCHSPKVTSRRTGVYAWIVRVLRWHLGAMERNRISLIELFWTLYALLEEARFEYVVRQLASSA